MDNSEIYREIKYSINTGTITTLPKSKLAQYAAALSRSNAYAHFGSSEFKQITETVRALLIASSSEEALTKIPNSAESPTSKKPNSGSNWHEKPLGKIWLQVIGGLILACAIYLIGSRFGIPL